MKQAFLLAFSICILLSCKTRHQQLPIPSQEYESFMEDDIKILKGVINRSLIENDTAFAWFKNNMKYGQTDAKAVEAFKQNSSKFTIVAFIGTWCRSTHNLLPGFYRLIDKSGYPESQITLIGTNQAKTTVQNLHTQYKIKFVPTFIVFKNGKEIGRVVEYGKYGTVDKELGEIVSNIK